VADSPGDRTMFRSMRLIQRHHEQPFAAAIQPWQADEPYPKLFDQLFVPLWRPFLRHCEFSLSRSILEKRIHRSGAFAGSAQATGKLRVEQKVTLTRNRECVSGQVWSDLVVASRSIAFPCVAQKPM